MKLNREKRRGLADKLLRDQVHGVGAGRAGAEGGAGAQQPYGRPCTELQGGRDSCTYRLETEGGPSLAQGH